MLGGGDRPKSDRLVDADSGTAAAVELHDVYVCKGLVYNFCIKHRSGRPLVSPGDYTR